jgi:PAS domain S-box-containing protein
VAVVSRSGPSVRFPSDDEIRVLHVDDEPDVTELSSIFLERLNADITVTEETNPVTALDVLSNEPIDCIISDYQMPEMNGVEFLRAVREEFPNLPFILFTARGNEEVATDATTAGVTAYVKKGGPDVYQLLSNQVEQNVARVRSERQARIANDRLLHLYEQTDGFYILNRDWTVLYWNQEMAVRTGRGPDEVLGKEFWEVFPEATETELHDRLQTVIETETADEFELFYDPHGSWVEVRAYPVEEGLFVHSREITEEKNRERELTRRNRILESFANTVSHDFRNPLQIAEGRLQLAQETGDFTHLEEVARAHNRMRDLIDDLLQLARGENVTTSVVSLRECATQAWETVSSGERQLTVLDDGEFEAYPSQIRQLFENLFWNAIDHGDATEIRVGTIDDGFYVEDNGRGVRSEDRDRIFEPGYSTSEDGTGYGLHIVANVADMHDWGVSVADGSDGGAHFEIRGVTYAETED